MWSIGLYGLFLLFLIAGLAHFRFPKLYISFMPRYFSHPGFWVKLTGVIEVLLAMGLLSDQFRAWSALGISLFLVAVLPVHVFMLQNRMTRFSYLPVWFLWLRIPFQGALIYWALHYAQPALSVN